MNYKTKFFIIGMILFVLLSVSIVSAVDNETSLVNEDIFVEERDVLSTIDNETLMLDDDYGWGKISKQENDDLSESAGKLVPYIDATDNVDYENCNDAHILKVGAQLLRIDGKQLFLVHTKPFINYTIKNQNGEVVYSDSQIGNSLCNFSSNYEIFQNMPNGIYYCTLTTKTTTFGGDYPGKYVAEDFSWTVQVPSTSKDISASKSTTKKNHYVKYVTVGKYKVKVWSDDSLSVQKQKVLKFLKKKIKKPHTYKIKGFKFKVSAKNYIKILYNKKYKLGVVSFKIKTNKFKKVKAPIYKTKKVTKYKWKYKKVKVSMEDYYDWEYRYYTDGTVNGWSCYKLERTDFDYGVANTHYVYLKKKVKYTATKKIVKGYKKVNVRVYAIGHSSKWVPCVAFRAIGKGVNQFAGDGCYYRL